MLLQMVAFHLPFIYLTVSFKGLPCLQLSENLHLAFMVVVILLILISESCLQNTDLIGLGWAVFSDALKALPGSSIWESTEGHFSWFASGFQDNVFFF